MTFRQVSGDKIRHGNPSRPDDLDLPPRRNSATNVHSHERGVHWEIDDELLIPPRESSAVAIDFRADGVVLVLKIGSNSDEQIAVDRFSTDLEILSRYDSDFDGS